MKYHTVGNCYCGSYHNQQELWEGSLMARISASKPDDSGSTPGHPATTCDHDPYTQYVFDWSGDKPRPVKVEFCRRCKEPLGIVGA